MKEETKNK